MPQEAIVQHFKSWGKPHTTQPQIFKERNIQVETHQKFTEKYHGKVFYVFSIKQGKAKIIQNPEIIQEIQLEIERLRQKQLEA